MLPLPPCSGRDPPHLGVQSPDHFHVLLLLEDHGQRPWVRGQGTFNSTSQAGGWGCDRVCDQVCLLMKEMFLLSRKSWNSVKLDHLITLDFALPAW